MEFKSKKLAKLTVLVAMIFIFGSGGALFANYYLFPHLANNVFFGKISWLQKFKENVTIINKREELVIREDEAVNKVASQAANAVVQIIELPKAKNPKLPASLNPVFSTGLILTGDGLVAGYRDSAQPADAEYRVILNSGAVHTAKLITRDPFTNLTFFKIEAGNLSTPALANSDDIFAGKKLIALSYSDEAYRNEFATGIVADIDRTFNLSGEAVSSAGKLEGVLRLDFAQGDNYVGSPVIDYKGELVGLIGRIEFNNRPEYFAIPANAIRRAIERLAGGAIEKYSNPGLSYIPITKAFALAHNLEKDRGALVYSASGKPGLAILANSPAQRAGLQLNDIVLAVGDQEVSLSNPLSNLLNRYNAGDAATLKIWRQSSEKLLEIKL